MKNFLLFFDSNSAAIPLGAELVVDGDMELADPGAIWLDGGGTPAVTRVADPRTGSGGSYAMDVTVAAAQASGVVTQVVTLEAGKTYRLSGWVKNIDATKIGIIVYSGGWATLYWIDMTATDWTQFGADFIAADTTARFYLTTTGAAGKHGRWDDISLREVL